MADRDEKLDFFRGMAMLLVLLHHSDAAIGEWILTFHMPLLFVLSGFTASLKPVPAHFGNYLKKQIMHLVIPYFLFEGINLAVWSFSLILQGGWQDLSEAVRAIVTCVNTQAYTGYYGRLWFWPCMFVSNILLFFINKLYIYINRKIPGKLYFLAISSLLLALSWYTSNVLNSRLPFAADTALMATVFLMAGYYFAEEIAWLVQKKHIFTDSVILLVSLCLLSICVFSRKAFCGMYVNVYGDYGYTLAAAVSGCIAFMVLANWLYELLCRINLGKQLVLWYGRNSLATFPVHLSIKIWMWNHIPWDYRPWYVLMAVMLVLNIPIVNFITRYLPFLLGKFRTGAGKACV